MPVNFTPSECLGLLEFGKFTLLHIEGSIPAEDAVAYVSSPMPLHSESLCARYPLEKDWSILTERFNWGVTSRPDSVYYELWSGGLPKKLPVKPFVAEKLAGFYCGARINLSNLDNRCTHIITSEYVDVKLWNISDPAVDVDFDFTVWYYMFHEDYFEDVMNLLTMRDRLLAKLVERA